MAKIVLQPAVKKLKPMKVLSYGPSYSGKTMSSILLAVGIVQKIRNCSKEDAFKHVILIDSEYGRGALYAHLGPFNYYEIEAPYHGDKLADAIKQINNMSEIDVIICDSLTHFWSKDGGILDQKAAKDKLGGNSYTNWQDVTAQFNRMIDTIMASPKHILATTRAKTDTVVVTEGGKAVPRSYGLKPELRDGIEYDFDIVFNIDKNSHNLLVDKGVPGIDMIYDIATPELGEKILDLFNSEAVVPERTKEDMMKSLRDMSKNNNMITFMQLALSGRKLDDLEIEALKELELNLINEIKKKQTSKAK